MTGVEVAAVSVGVTVSVAVIGAAVSAVKAAWGLRGWLAGEFTATRKLFYDTIAAHETLDQQRHEDNLGRFSDIRAALARGGLMNGHDATDHH